MQTKTQSLIETCVSVFIGFLVAYFTQVIIYPYFGIHTSTAENLTIAGWFTLVSVIRGYLVRRGFNWLWRR